MRRPGSPFLFIICILAIIFTGWESDRQSCERSNNGRAGLALYFHGATDSADKRLQIDTKNGNTALAMIDRASYKRDYEAWKIEAPLSCKGSLPQVKLPKSVTVQAHEPPPPALQTGS